MGHPSFTSGRRFSVLTFLFPALSAQNMKRAGPPSVTRGPMRCDILASHAFCRERGKEGAPSFISDLAIPVGHSRFPPFPQTTPKEWSTVIYVWSTISCLAFLFPTLSAKNADKDGPPIILGRSATNSYLRLSVWGSGWIRTRKSSGAFCLNWISSSVDSSCTRESGSSSENVQWQET